MICQIRTPNNTLGGYQRCPESVPEHSQTASFATGPATGSSATPWTVGGIRKSDIRGKSKLNSFGLSIPAFPSRSVGFSNRAGCGQPVALRAGDNMLDGWPREPEFPCDRRRFKPGLEGGEDQALLSRRNGAGLLRAAFRGTGRLRRPVFVHGTLRHFASAPPGLLDRRLHQPVQCVVVQQAERPSEVGRQGETRLRRGAVVARGG